MKAVGIILAGGNSSKMRELTHKRAVAAMPVAGSYRSIDFALSNMSNSHIQKVAVLTQYNARSLNEHLNSSKWWDFGRKQGTLNLYSYDTPDGFVQKLTDYMENTEYKKQNLALTRTTVCPAVLVETGYMSNPQEYQYLIKGENQKAMAEKIGKGIEKYFENIQNTDLKGALPFRDVNTDDWYYNSVKKVYENNLFSGTTKTRFSPKSNITKGYAYGSAISQRGYASCRW